MPVEICKQCGEMMTEQLTAGETVNLPGAPKYSARFYEQWFACRNGHRRGYISAHSWLPGDLRVTSPTDRKQPARLG